MCERFIEEYRNDKQIPASKHTHTYIASAEHLLLASIGHHHLHFATDNIAKMGLGTKTDTLGHGPTDRSGHALGPMESSLGLNFAARAIDAVGTDTELVEMHLMSDSRGTK